MKDLKFYDIKNWHKHWKKEVMLITKMIKTKKHKSTHLIEWDDRVVWVFSGL